MRNASRRVKEKERKLHKIRGNAHTATMKRKVLKSSILAGVSSIMMMFSGLKDISLKDVEKPYVGEYSCREARLGNEDLLEDFDYITLDLKADGNFVLYYRKKGEKGRREKGEYTYDNTRKVLILHGVTRKALNVELPLEKGEFVIVMRVGLKTLRLAFEQK